MNSTLFIVFSFYDPCCPEVWFVEGKIHSVVQRLQACHDYTKDTALTIWMLT